eukprot:86875-Chlamydomonas_euryale.AAC.5
MAASLTRTRACPHAWVTSVSARLHACPHAQPPVALSHTRVGVSVTLESHVTPKLSPAVPPREGLARDGTACRCQPTKLGPALLGPAWASTASLGSIQVRCAPVHAMSQRGQSRGSEGADPRRACLC